MRINRILAAHFNIITELTLHPSIQHIGLTFDKDQFADIDNDKKVDAGSLLTDNKY